MISREVLEEFEKALNRIKELETENKRLLSKLRKYQWDEKIKDQGAGR